MNTFVAHLARIDAAFASLEHYGLWTLSWAFGPLSCPIEEVDYHVPAAAAWMCILGKRIYISSVSAAGDSGATFNQTKWDRCKRGFESWCEEANNLLPETTLAAKTAWHEMSNLEMEGS